MGYMVTRGLYPYSKTGLSYYYFTLYAIDTSLVLDPTNTLNGKVLRDMEV